MHRGNAGRAAVPSPSASVFGMDISVEQPRRRATKKPPEGGFSVPAFRRRRPEALSANRIR
jgi:hypothetical protein